MIIRRKVDFLEGVAFFQCDMGEFGRDFCHPHSEVGLLLVD